MANDLSNEFSTRCIDLRRMIGKVLARVGLTALFAVSMQAALAQQGDAIEKGRLQFIDKCAVCHGPEGKGDGVLAPSLDEQPTDLTRLSESYGGTFPRAETFNKIWGRSDEIISTHEANEMPAFYVAPMLGNDYDFEDSAGRLSPIQIEQIIRFLETIQE